MLKKGCDHVTRADTSVIIWHFFIICSGDTFFCLADKKQEFYFDCTEDASTDEQDLPFSVFISLWYRPLTTLLPSISAFIAIKISISVHH